MSEITITKDNFGEVVLKSQVPVLVDFWATWCGPCRMLSPIIAEIAKEYEGKVVVGKVNVDQEPELANEFDVQSIPMVLVFKNGVVTASSIGYRPKDQIEALIK